MLLLEQNIAKKGQEDEAISELEFDEKRGNKNSKEYKVEIHDNVFYARETESHLL